MKFSIISAIMLATAFSSFGEVQKSTLKELKLGDNIVTDVDLSGKISSSTDEYELKIDSQGINFRDTAGVNQLRLGVFETDGNSTIQFQNVLGQSGSLILPPVNGTLAVKEEIDSLVTNKLDAVTDAYVFKAHEAGLEIGDTAGVGYYKIGLFGEVDGTPVSVIKYQDVFGKSAQLIFPSESGTLATEEHIATKFANINLKEKDQATIQDIYDTLNAILAELKKQ